MLLKPIIVGPHTVSEPDCIIALYKIRKENQQISMFQWSLFYSETIHGPLPR